MNDKPETIKNRIKKEKELLLDQLKKIQIVSIACEKTGVGRSTYYRWRQADKKFCALSDDAISEGVVLINDLAESQLLTEIKGGNMTGIIFWLKHRHPAYETRIEIKQSQGMFDEKLTKKQKEIIEQALNVSSFKKIENMPIQQDDE